MFICRNVIQKSHKNKGGNGTSDGGYVWVV